MAGQNNGSNMMRYAGLATTWLVALLAAVWIGHALDGWLKWKFPLFIIVLPLLMLIMLLWQIIKEFSKPGK